MSLKHNLKKLFTFSKKERIAFFTLIIGLVIVAGLPFLMSESDSSKATIMDSSWVKAANELQELDTAKTSSTSSSIKDNRNFEYERTDNDFRSVPKTEMFPFDPNTLDAEGFSKLGLRDRTIRTLMNYRNKGGKFKKPTDLSKIYGLRADEYERLEPYIRVTPSASNSDFKNYKNADWNEGTAKETGAKPQYTPKTIEVNAADMAAYESLYGIGSKLAARIINFRDKLGGFYAINQVGETFGLPDSTFQKIKTQLKVNSALVKTIHLNNCTYDELNLHPYISSQTAFQILKYRKEKGKFTAVSEIKDLVQGNDIFEKIAPYITVE